MAWDIVHRGRKIQVAVDRSIAANGDRPIQTRRAIHPGAVAILPVVDAQHVCLLRNHRFILNEVLWEIPAGTLEPGEAVEAAAIRELAEETGYQAKHGGKVCEFYPSPGILSERTHLFVASELTAGAMRPEADEQLEPHIVPGRRPWPGCAMAPSATPKRCWRCCGGNLFPFSREPVNRFAKRVRTGSRLNGTLPRRGGKFENKEDNLPGPRSSVGTICRSC